MKDFTEHLTSGKRILDDHFEFFVGNSHFDASASANKRIRRTGSRALGIAGFLCDEIQEISQFPSTAPPCRGQKLFEGFEKYWVGWMQMVREGAKRFSRLRPPEVFFRTACMDTGPKDKPFLPNDCMLFDRSVFKDDELASQRYRPHQKSTSSATKAWEERLTKLVMAMRLFSTREGRLGLAHRNAAIGDGIAILASGETPFVLRPVHAEGVQGEASIIIGACYLDGVFEMSAPLTACTVKKQVSCTVRLCTSEPNVC